MAKYKCKIYWKGAHEAYDVDYSSTEEPAKNGVISDMILASTVSILNSIKNMEEKA